MVSVESVLEIGPGLSVGGIGLGVSIIVFSLFLIFLLGVSLAVLGSIGTSGVGGDD